MWLLVLPTLLTSFIGLRKPRNCETYSPLSWRNIRANYRGLAGRTLEGIQTFRADAYVFSGPQAVLHWRSMSANDRKICYTSWLGDSWKEAYCTVLRHWSFLGMVLLNMFIKLFGWPCILTEWVEDKQWFWDCPSHAISVQLSWCCFSTGDTTYYLGR